MRSRVLIATALVVVVVASLWYLVAPPRTAPAYRERAAQTLESLRSHVQTARLWGRAERRGRVTRQATTIALQEAEDDARATAAAFSPYDPPAAVGDLRAQVMRVSGDVTEALAAVRIAAHGDAWGRVAQLSDNLDGLAARLERLAHEAHP